MCDYSLEIYGSRPAKASERYVTTRFPSGSIGLTATGDCATAICVQYETTMVLESIPKDVQTALSLRDIEEATFIRLDHGAYRDGVRFRNGREISIQQLSVGVGAIVTTVVETASHTHHSVSAL